MPRHRRIIVLASLVLGLGAGVVACAVTRGSDDEPAAWATCEGDAAGEAETTDLDVPLPTVTARRIAELEAVTDLTTRAGDPAWYVAERAGGVYRVTPDGRATEILAVDADLQKERGLLSITFDPSGEHLYVNHTDAGGTSRVAAYPADADGTLGEPVEILTSTRPRANHNVDDLVFGPDGHLYISAGDGGAEPIDDTGIEEGDPERRALDPASPFGKILRIDPDPTGGGYDVPPDNPYVDDDGAAPEVWASGFRNPWRFSFDRENGDLWVADVGHYCAEEVNHVPAADASGASFGWSAYEGFLRFNEDQEADDPVFPIHTYVRGELPDEPGVVQCAIVGGHVYRGEAIPDLGGAYLFGDFCAGQVRALRTDADGAVDVDVLVDGLSGIQSLAEDQDGEVYVLAGDGAHVLEPAAG